MRPHGEQCFQLDPVPGQIGDLTPGSRKSLPQIAVENLECWWDRILWILSIIIDYYQGPLHSLSNNNFATNNHTFSSSLESSVSMSWGSCSSWGCITIITKDMMTLWWNKFNLIWFTEHCHYTELGTNCSANNCESNYRTFSHESISQSLSPHAHKVNIQWS